MSSVLRYDKSKFAVEYRANSGTCKSGDRTHRQSYRDLSLWQPLRNFSQRRMPGQFMVEIAASRSPVCTAVSRIGLHSFFVADSCLPLAANRIPSAGWIRKTVRDFRDSRMITGLVKVKHMSDAGLGASLKLVTHLHKHTKPWIVSALWRHVCWHMPVVSLILQFCSDQCVHGSRRRRRT